MAILENKGLSGTAADGESASPRDSGSELSKQDFDDQEQLARLGKKSVLKRTFRFLSILGFTCTVLVTWEGASILFVTGLQNGGPQGTIINFLLVWLGNLSVFAALTELLSMAPTSGGQYHWVSMLAPRSCAKFLSYLTGWFTLTGWQGTFASGCFLLGTMIQGIINMTHPEYVGKGWQGALFMYAMAVCCTFINCMVSSLLPKFEMTVLVLHIAGFFAILIPVVYLAPHYDAHFVFRTFFNLGEFPTNGLSFFVGITGNVFAFVGADAAFHMVEEVRNPSVVVPRSIMAAILINGAAGFAMIIAMFFCLGDIDKTTKSSTGFPFMDIFLNATKSRAGAAGMSIIILVLAFSAVTGIQASASRVFWSFARDRGVPGSSFLAKVDPRTHVPRNSVIVTAIITCLLGLINVGSLSAFNNIVSLSITGLHSSYLVAASLLLYRRCTKGFKLPDKNALPATAENTTGELIWGPWHIPGVWGIINNAFACIYLIIVIFFSFWPTTWHVTPETMNYSVLVTGAVAIFSVCYYFFWNKGKYQGPVVEI